MPLENGRGTYLLAVFLPAEGLVLCQVAVDDKPNEIPAAQQALKHLNLQGKIVTADALHTQRELSQIVVEAGANYVWIVKDNQPALWRDVYVRYTGWRLSVGTAEINGALRTALPIKFARTNSAKQPSRDQCLRPM